MVIFPGTRNDLTGKVLQQLQLFHVFVGSIRPHGRAIKHFAEN